MYSLNLNRKMFTLAGVLVCSVLMPVSVSAVIMAFPQDLVGFNSAAGNPPVAIDFDGILPGTDITGATISGVTFLGPNAPLIVVDGNDTFTPSGFSGAPNPSSNKLFSTSPDNVLSPGGIELAPGPNNAVENDDLTLVFVDPVSEFGFDHLSQSADGFSFTSIQVFDPSDGVLFTGSIPISNLGGGGAPGGADFWGIVSDTADIKRIAIDEADGNNVFPDSNIGFDTFRFNSDLFQVPEPSILLLIGTGLVGLIGFRRKFRTS